jgi:hypothetical protein
VLAAVVVVPMYAVYVAPFVILGFAIREFIGRRWLTGAVLAACAGLAYVVLRIAAQRFVTWAEERRQREQQ